MPRKVSTASTWWPTWRNALATCAPLAIETSRSELLPPKRTAIFIVGIDINRFEDGKHVSNGRDCSDEKGPKQAKKDLWSRNANAHSGRKSSDASPQKSRESRSDGLIAG